MPKETKKSCNKCKKCQNYNMISDYCKVKNEKHCSAKKEFSKCEDFLISERLIMF